MICPLEGLQIIRSNRTTMELKPGIFMLDGYPTKEMNKKYEDAYVKIFNYASVPFYWKDIEPERGKYRYDANSPIIFRRPAPDRVVEFCKSHNIMMKGHTLVWDSPVASIPEWAPKNRDSLKILLRERIESIADRYKNDIRYWMLPMRQLYEK